MSTDTHFPYDLNDPDGWHWTRWYGAVAQVIIGSGVPVRPVPGVDDVVLVPRWVHEVVVVFCANPRWLRIALGAVTADEELSAAIRTAYCLGGYKAAGAVVFTVLLPYVRAES